MCACAGGNREGGPRGSYAPKARPALARPIFGEVFAHDIVEIESPVKGLRARWVIDGRHKLIWPHAVGAAPELFDVHADPLEERDLAKARPKLVATLQARITGWWDVPAPTGRKR